MIPKLRVVKDIICKISALKYLKKKEKKKRKKAKPTTYILLSKMFMEFIQGNSVFPTSRK